MRNENVNEPQKPQSCQTDFSGSISILKGTRENQRQIISKYKFFTPNEDLIVKVDNEKITFKKPHIDYNGRTFKPKLINSGWVTFQIVADLPIVKNLEFDLDESNIDERVVYYR
jgi:hypothetical protein